MVWAPPAFHRVQTPCVPHCVALWLVISWFLIPDGLDSWLVLIFWSCCPFRALSSNSFSRIVYVLDFDSHVTKLGFKRHCTLKNKQLGHLQLESFHFSRTGSSWLLIHFPRPANVSRHFNLFIWFSLVVSITIATAVSGVVAQRNLTLYSILSTCFFVVFAFFLRIGFDWPPIPCCFRLYVYQFIFAQQKAKQP